MVGWLAERVETSASGIEEGLNAMTWQLNDVVCITGTHYSV